MTKRQIMRVVRFTERTAAAAVILLVLAFSSCRKVPVTSIVLPEEKEASGAGLSIGAVFLYDPGEIEHLFKTFLPLYGVVPVLVTVRNDGTGTLGFFSRNTLALRDGFDGFSLEVAGVKLEPLHPLDVVSMARNEGRQRHYRKSGKIDIVTGTVLPPAGVYYAWQGFREYREYKPIVSASLPPVLYCGLFEPLILRPGEEKTGYLFFAMEEEKSPYESIEKVVEREEKEETVLVHGLKENYPWRPELVVNPAQSGPGTEGSYGTLAVAAKVPAREIFFLPEPGTGPRGEGFLAIYTEGGSESLVLGRMNGGSVEGTPLTVKEFSGASSRIADAAAGEGRLACAVNFKRKSRIFLLAGAGVGGGAGIESGTGAGNGGTALAGGGGIGEDDGSEEPGGFSLVGEMELPRNVRRVFMTREGFFALLSDGFCRFFPFDDRRAGDYVKLGNNVRDAVVSAGGDLLVFDGRDVSIFGLAEKDRFARKGNPLPLRGDPTVAGAFGDTLILKVPGEDDLGDTLLVYDMATRAEISRISFRGRIQRVSIHPKGILASMQEGTILDIRLGAGGTPYIHGSAWLPFDLMGLSGGGSEITAVSYDGLCYHGPLDGAPPLAGTEGAGITRTPIGMSSPESRKLKEKKSWKDR